ncbi:MAG: glycosyltransferase family 2 protein [Lachnospiraceae bacterium]|nr:glycosyltransferase family 2 protein [Lachnospiraceae bacterium]
MTLERIIIKIKFNYRRIKNCGSPAGVVRKIIQRAKRRHAVKQFGHKSYPSEETRKFEETCKFEKAPKISILVPLYNTPEAFLRDMIESVKAQTYSNWELCLADGSTEDHPEVAATVKEYATGDERIVYHKLARNGGISENTNECLKLASGEYIGLLDHDDLIHPEALFLYAREIEKQDPDFIYCDEATFKKGSIDKIRNIHFKPDFAPDNLLANNYICHFSVFKRSLLEGTELFRSAYDGSQDHDMILRLTGKAKRIVHVPRILYYWRFHQGSTSAGLDAKMYAIDAAKNAISDFLSNHGFKDYEITSSRALETIFRIKYKPVSNPLVSIIIPNKDHAADLKRCIESVEEKSTYGNYEIIIVENNSTTAEISELYRELAAKYSNLRVITYKGEFNYSAINNFAVKETKGEYLLFLNNDTKVITPDWIEELLPLAERENTGAVGARLLYDNKHVQHAGIVLGLGEHRAAGHIFHNVDYDNIGYMGKMCYIQNVSAVTGACMMVSRAKFDAVGGFNEDLKIALNDVDFCLKLRAKGLLNVFNPYCELYHYESKSRGKDTDKEKAERYSREVNLFKEIWHEVLDQGDPYFNPNLSLDHPEYTVKV